MEEVCSTRELRTRNCIRVLPIQYTCEATMQALKATAQRVQQVSFPVDGPAKKFSVDFRHRGVKLKRLEVRQCSPYTLPHQTGLGPSINMLSALRS